MDRRVVALIWLLSMSACRRASSGGDVDEVFPTGTYSLAIDPVSNTCGIDTSSIGGQTTTMQVEGEDDADIVVTLAGSTFGPSYVSSDQLSFAVQDAGQDNLQNSDGSTCTYDEDDTFTFLTDASGISGTMQAELTDPTGECASCAITFEVSAVQVGD